MLLLAARSMRLLPSLAHLISSIGYTGTLYNYMSRMYLHIAIYP